MLVILEVKTVVEPPTTTVEAGRVVRTPAWVKVVVVGTRSVVVSVPLTTVRVEIITEVSVVAPVSVHGAVAVTVVVVARLQSSTSRGCMTVLFCSATPV